MYITPILDNMPPLMPFSHCEKEDKNEDTFPPLPGHCFLNMYTFMCVSLR